MFDADENVGRNGLRTLWIILSGFGIVITSGVIAGFTAQHQNGGGGTFSGIAIAIFAAAILAIIGYGYWAWQNAKAMKVPGENLTRRELLNRCMLSGCIFLGGIMGFGMAMVEGDGGAEGITIFSSSPLPTSFALAFAFVLLVIVPAITWCWHRYAADEMEESAYREGTYYAFYVYAIGAPLWWVLWRGGLAPAPDGIAIYYVTIMVCAVVWMWKKYR